MATITCPRCGADNPDARMNCLECGINLERALELENLAEVDDLFRWARREVKLRTRGQHWVFAHDALPSLFFDNPKRTVSTLGEKGSSFLLSLWMRVGESMDSPADLVAPQGLSCELRDLGVDTTVALVTLPPPQGMTEAYFVALVHRPWTSLFSLRRPLARYITLELGFNLDGSPRTVLCERTANGTHGNMGAGPAPTLEAFFATVRDLV